MAKKRAKKVAAKPADKMLYMTGDKGNTLPHQIALSDSPEMTAGPVVVAINATVIQDRFKAAIILRQMASKLELSRYPMSDAEAELADTNQANIDAGKPAGVR